MKKMKSSAPRGNIFSNVQSARVPQTRFNLSFENKLSCDAGKLIPVLCQEVLPGDKFNVAVSAFIRTQPMIAPLMHNVDINFAFFFVPNRLVWDNWEKFITGNSSVVAPFIPLGTFTQAGGVAAIKGIGSLADYLGLPVTAASARVSDKVSSLPFRAYSLIYEHYFADENLTQLPWGTDSVPKSDGYSVTDLSCCNLMKVCWQKDYFTSALPFAQKGNPVTISGLPVRLSGDYSGKPGFVNDHGTKVAASASVPHMSYGLSNAGADGADVAVLHEHSASTLGTWVDLTHKTFYNPDGSLITDALPITAIRKANALQRFLELNAVGGSRYSEFLLNHFGVRCTDARAQDPEFLGFGKMPVVISEVQQTSSTDNTTPQGNLAGRGVSSGVVGMNKPIFFTEHGFLMCLMYIRPTSQYMSQGVHRKWQRFDKFDYFFPILETIGEQEVKSIELYLSGSAYDDDTFGYQSRYAEYKFNDNEVHGSFRSSLDYWHMARKFSSRPSLNGSFVECNPRKDIFAVSEQNNDSFLVDLYLNVDSVRPMTMFSTPSL